jgi:hypothetical protein
LKNSVVEQHHFDAALAPGKNFDAAAAPILLCTIVSKPFSKAQKLT